MYCIDIRNPTYTGLGYENGSWDESNVPNIGYVNRVLNSYYPDQPGLPEAANDNIRAAAVQAAVWFFSDGYVLEDTDSIRALTAQIVTDVLAAGPLTEPPAPDVSITPPVAAGPVDGVAGPFTVTSGTVTELTVGVTPGYTLYTDAAGTVPLVGTTVPAGTQLWVRNTAQTTDPAQLTATAVVPVQTANVYLYAGTNPQVTTAQKLILAADSQVESNAQATAEFFIPGDLVVNKIFAGEGAGLQGAITLNVTCGAAGVFVIEIPAGTAATVSQTIPNLPVGTVCEVSEPVTGSNTQVTVTPVLPGTVTITANGPNVLDVANTVDLNPGSLTVVKSVRGAAAGLQGDITVIVTCDAVGIEEALTIPAGSAAGDYAGTITDIPAGTGSPTFPRALHARSRCPKPVLPNWWRWPPVFRKWLRSSRAVTSRRWSPMTCPTSTVHSC
ncbi:thioester domain-containing protein [Arthrobacter sp. zg.Y20]|uniref:thioester domain-containing protein n=1 Tax=unclassified Arthrobacter TaxID=235627 RepID=UPI001E442BEF|nr:MULTISPECIES: thioester domain-containing protein [unclassified Arthrobacter]MDK1317708.1 thioester domain-containing protein [Arthrobacter sp. zg.Y20]WIB06694.1 thioester domain-containing protein [Arthrobacter sp. zg-Y20]